MIKSLLLLPAVLAILATTGVAANARPMHHHHRHHHHHHHMMHHH